MAEARRLFVVSELYYPELTSTGYYLTKIAERLAREREVHVITAQPTYAARGTVAPASEVRNGVSIERCWSTRLNKDVLPLRVVNALSIAASLSWRLLLRARRGDEVLVVTNPPLLPFKVWGVSRMRGARVTLLVHDVYPDVAIAAGIISRNGLIARLLRWLTDWLYGHVDRIVVIGRDMADFVGKRMPAERQGRIVLVTNWADTADVVPVSLPPRSEFVVLYSGNMGRTHGLELLVDAATILRDDRRIRFRIAGTGAKRALVERLVKERGLENVHVEDPAPRERLSEHLGAADLCVIAFMPGMYGVSVPSRMYNIMAAGRPILAIADPGSELSRVVEEERIGWTVDASRSADDVAQLIRKASAEPERRAMGERARVAAVERYAEAKVLDEVARSSRTSLPR